MGRWRDGFRAGGQPTVPITIRNEFGRIAPVNLVPPSDPSGAGMDRDPPRRIAGSGVAGRQRSAGVAHRSREVKACPP